MALTSTRTFAGGGTRGRYLASSAGAAAMVTSLAGAEDFGVQLQSDCESLKEIVAGLDRLEQQLSDAQAGVAARRRGYFTPNEDDLVRQMLLAYRSYRLGIYEIIYRYIDYEQIGDPTLQLRAFMVGFAAA